MRLIKTLTNGDNVAKIYRDTEWQEYRTRFFFGGVYQSESDYFTDDKTEAIESAVYILNNIAK